MDGEINSYSTTTPTEKKQIKFEPNHIRTMWARAPPIVWLKIMQPMLLLWSQAKKEHEEKQKKKAEKRRNRRAYTINNLCDKILPHRRFGIMCFFWCCHSSSTGKTFSLSVLLFHGLLPVSIVTLCRVLCPRWWSAAQRCPWFDKATMMPRMKSRQCAARW